MKVLLLCTAHQGGGAAQATLRLLKALNKAGVDARLLTLYSTEDNKIHHIDSLFKGYLGKVRALSYKVIERLDIIRHSSVKSNLLWRFSSAPYSPNTLDHHWFQWADIIHLHWVNHGLLSLEQIHKLSHWSKPIIWTLHDLWPITGGCHIPFKFYQNNLNICPEYYLGCTQCPLLPNSKYPENLLSAKKLFNHYNIHYIAVSKREADLVRKSSLNINHNNISIISPNLDLTTNPPSQPITYPWYQSDINYIILVAANPSDPVKGPYLLQEVCIQLKEICIKHCIKIELLLVGHPPTTAPLLELAIPTHFLGLKSEEELQHLYTLASICISTSIFETFGQTLIESLAKGTPVIAFRSFGPEDIIQNGVNGYLIDSYNARLMAESIVQLLYDISTGKITKEHCQDSINHFDDRPIAEQHIALYKKILVSKRNQ